MSILIISTMLSKLLNLGEIVFKYAYIEAVQKIRESKAGDFLGLTSN